MEYLAAVMQQTGEDWSSVEPDAVHRPADAQRRAAGPEDAGRHRGAADARRCRRQADRPPAETWMDPNDQAAQNCSAKPQGHRSLRQSGAKQPSCQGLRQRPERTNKNASQ